MKQIITCRNCGYETATSNTKIRCNVCNITNHAENNVDRRKKEAKQNE